MIMTDNQTPGIRRIGQLSIPVRDLDRAVRFYRDTLGLALLFSVSGLAFFDCGGVRIMLAVPENGAFERTGTVFYFDTADIRASYEALAARGVKMTDKPHLIAEMNGVQTWMAFFEDPDGNTLALMSEFAAP